MGLGARGDHGGSRPRRQSAGHRVVVAMSGGVDSSVAAALLVERGFEVVGISLQALRPWRGDGAQGCVLRRAGHRRREAGRRASRHCALRSRLREPVQAGSHRRFRRQLSPRRDADPVRPLAISGSSFATFSPPRAISAPRHSATGHYVRRIMGPGGPELHKACDAARDQSYFLFATTRAELDYLRFPLGRFAKGETRELARTFRARRRRQAGQQDICFVPQGSYVDIVERLQPRQVSPAILSI